MRTIREGQVYEGQRVRLRALLGNARATVQVDIGFGDVVTPWEARMPTLIDDLPAPELLAYPLVSVIAEKFEAMVNLGVRNTRMKDFYDVWALSETFDVDRGTLRDAVVGCFERRGTEWTLGVPYPLTPGFYSGPARQRLWHAYGNVGTLLDPPQGPLKKSACGLERFWDPFVTAYCPATCSRRAGPGVDPGGERVTLISNWANSLLERVQPLPAGRESNGERSTY